MKKNKRLRDIRCFATNSDIIDQYTVRIDFEDKYGESVFEVMSIAKRFVAKLRENVFKVSEFDHIDLYFTDKVLTDSVIVQEYVLVPWRISILCGLDLKKWTEFSTSQRYDFVCNKISDSLKLFTQSDEQNLIVHEVTKQAITYHENLNFIIKEKKYKDFHLSIKSKIQDYKPEVNLFLEVYDIKSAEVSTLDMITCHHIDDAYFLIDRIILSGDVVTIKPKTSEVAATYTCSYRTPIKVKLNLE